MGATLISLLAIRLSKSHEQTAWNPTGVPSGLMWSFGTIGEVMAIGIGRLEKMVQAFHSETLLLGVGFLAVGLVVGRAQPLRQRLRAGTKDNRPCRPSVVQLHLFFCRVCLWFVGFVFHSRPVGIGKSKSVLELAFVPTTWWLGQGWFGPNPYRLYSCLLNSCQLGGEADDLDYSNPFDETLESALRINPLEIKRILSLPSMVMILSKLREFQNWMIRYVPCGLDVSRQWLTTYWVGELR